MIAACLPYLPCSLWFFDFLALALSFTLLVLVVSLLKYSHGQHKPPHVNEAMNELTIPFAFCLDWMY